MYAVIKTGGKQYKVEKGDILKVEKLDKEAGKSIKINDVLMLIDGEKVTVGTPILKEAHVNAKIESHGRGPKIKIIKNVTIISYWIGPRSPCNFLSEQFRYPPLFF